MYVVVLPRAEKEEETRIFEYNVVSILCACFLLKVTTFIAGARSLFESCAFS